MGIAKHLFESAGLSSPVFITHWTFALDPIMGKHFDKFNYDPYRA
jgi:hypothetical protein